MRIRNRPSLTNAATMHGIQHVRADRTRADERLADIHRTPYTASRIISTDPDPELSLHHTPYRSEAVVSRLALILPTQRPREPSAPRTPLAAISIENPYSIRNVNYIYSFNFQREKQNAAYVCLCFIYNVNKYRRTI